MEFQRNSDLLAVACDDLGIRVIDIETQRVVREFWGHRNRITDMVSNCFSLYDMPGDSLFITLLFDRLSALTDDGSYLHLWMQLSELGTYQLAT
jgi:WD40 repeat protein